METKNRKAGGTKAVVGKGKPYVLYFCSKQLGETAGLGSEALRARSKKKGVRPYKFTIFESQSVLDAFKKAGFTEFYKVLAARENLELVKKYRVRQDNTLVFCAPNGEMVTCLAGPNCSQTNTLKVLKAWPMIYQAWQKRFAAKNATLRPPG